MVLVSEAVLTPTAVGRPTTTAVTTATTLKVNTTTAMAVDTTTIEAQLTETTTSTLAATATMEPTTAPETTVPATAPVVPAASRDKQSSGPELEITEYGNSIRKTASAEKRTGKRASKLDGKR